MGTSTFSDGERWQVVVGVNTCLLEASVKEFSVSSEVEEGLIRYFKEHINVDVCVSTPLIEEQVIDSIGVMELISFIQESYEVELDMDDLTVENFESIAHICQLIEAKRAES